MQTNQVAAKVDLARSLYLSGYNCSQSVFAAFFLYVIFNSAKFNGTGEKV